MADLFRVACVQLNASESKADNIERAGLLVARAAATGADLIVLPEKWNGIGPPDFLRANAESLDDGETVEAMSSWARDHKVTIVGGSIPERREGRDKLSNTSVVFDPDGEIAALYRKIHMFDVEVGGQVYRESESEEPGEEASRVTDVEGWKLGLTICYDLRFPSSTESSRSTAGDHHSARGVHAVHREGPLGASAARACRREPVLHRRAQPVGHAPGRQSVLRPVDDRGSMGRGARAGA